MIFWSVVALWAFVFFLHHMHQLRIADLESDASRRSAELTTRIDELEKRLRAAERLLKLGRPSPFDDAEYPSDEEARRLDALERAGG